MAARDQLTFSYSKTIRATDILARDVVISKMFFLSCDLASTIQGKNLLPFSFGVF